MNSRKRKLILQILYYHLRKKGSITIQEFHQLYPYFKNIHTYKKYIIRIHQLYPNQISMKKQNHTYILIYQQNKSDLHENNNTTIEKSPKKFNENLHLSSSSCNRI